jgi:hypothetical protein
MFEIIDKILCNNNYSSSAASDIVKYDFELINQFLRTKYPNHGNIFKKIDFKRFMGLFVNWITFTWCQNPFEEKYWILNLNDRNHKLFYQIRGFNNIEEFMETKEFTYKPSNDYEDIELGLFINNTISFENFSKEYVNAVVLGMMLSHLKLMKHIAGEMKGKALGYNESHPYQIGYYFNNQLKILYAVDK